jgi:hypothetical protein
MTPLRIVRIKGGLGNQMFTYAFGCALENATGERVLYDISHYTHPSIIQKIDRKKLVQKGIALRQYELDIFPNIKLCEATDTQIKKCKHTSVKKHLLKLILKRKNTYVIEEERLNFYQENLLQDRDDAYYNGYFQCEKYFAHISEIIKHQFQFLPISGGHNLDLQAKIMSKQNSVSIHIRRGDYLNISNDLLCTMNYYKNAVKYVIERIPNAVFFVFCEDEEWIMEGGNFDIGCPFTYINAEGNGNDMYLMTLCNHNIVANSSYSWWGAWLNNKKNKIVIAPDHWDGMQVCDSWVTIHNGTE